MRDNDRRITPWAASQAGDEVVQKISCVVSARRDLTACYSDPRLQANILASRLERQHRKGEGARRKIDFFFDEKYVWSPTMARVVLPGVETILRSVWGIEVPPAASVRRAAPRPLLSREPRLSLGFARLERGLPGETQG